MWCAALIERPGGGYDGTADGEGAVACTIPGGVSQRSGLRGVFVGAALAGWFRLPRVRQGSRGGAISCPVIAASRPLNQGRTPHSATWDNAISLLPSPLTKVEAALIQKTRGLNVLNYSPKDYHKELTKSLFELGQAVSLKRDEIAELQSW